ncbi:MULTISPECIES: hypothetical protein [Cyanophyceae]|uniref:hypothetical protein n=1 Tax=Cyanophyceae TaxID=3028117 RepID=UPI0016864BBE|nr:MULTISPECIES: hypothetical protein [Cyanophyceae]MBD1914594.1 hypothetical protein [Phormidium sp. FACHB-77]MBD2030318.1 hypothetical protein [Phormidium sp. FACHB-322]MBD2049863.1 hypothetical protein [Leptolyngbya sp. FACHB-60]
MKVSNSAPISSDSVLARMAPEMATTFSPAQVQALQAALTSRRHFVNIRLSLPLGMTRVYLVLLAGTEMRSMARCRQEAVRQPLWTPTNAVVIVGTMGMGILALLAMVQLTSINLSAVFSPKAAPASIPFKTDRTSCEESGRTWQEGDCLDFGHDPTF